MGRLMHPEEIAAASAFLISPLAAGITGIVIPVRGGLGVVAHRDPLPQAAVALSVAALGSEGKLW